MCRPTTFLQLPAHNSRTQTSQLYTQLVYIFRGLLFVQQQSIFSDPYRYRCLLNLPGIGRLVARCQYYIGMEL